MAEQTFQPGDNSFLASDAPGHKHGAFFEDDGETGYFYAVADVGPSDPRL